MHSAAEHCFSETGSQPFAGRAGVLFGGLTVLVSFGFVALLITLWFILTLEQEWTANGLDFRVLWAAAQLADEGNPLTVLNNDEVAAVSNTYVVTFMHWTYPPGFMGYLPPLELIPYLVAVLVCPLMSLGLNVWACRPFTAGIGAFWLAGFSGALAALRSRRCILAGAEIGCLQRKPQLGMMIPFARFGFGERPTILAAIAITVVLLLGPTQLSGLEYWSLLQALLVEYGDRMLNVVQSVRPMICPILLFICLGLCLRKTLATPQRVTLAR
jgi:hypothetical protein